MLDFELTVNDNAIIESGNADDVKQWDLALLHQFIKDKQHVQYLTTEYIALDMGFWTPEDVEKRLGIGDKSQQDIFVPSIEALPDDVRKVWQEIQDDPEINFNWCLESVTDCFDTKLIEAHIEEVKEDEEEQEIITEDINRPLTFDDIITALDVISTPVEFDSVPLSCDPDDFSVV
jgi:hypothetical protein